MTRLDSNINAYSEVCTCGIRVKLTKVTVDKLSTFQGLHTMVESKSIAA